MEKMRHREVKKLASTHTAEMVNPRSEAENRDSGVLTTA